MMKKKWAAYILALVGILLLGGGGFYVLTTERVEPSSNFELGQYYFNHGEYADGTYDLDKARYYFEEAIREDGEQDNPLLWYQLGRIDFLEGKFDAAIYKFNKQVEQFEETLPNVHYMLGLTYGFKAKDTNSPFDWQAAEESFLRFIELDPQAPWPKVDLAWVYFAQGKYEDMRELMAPEAELFVHNAWVQNMYGLALHNTGSSTEAVLYFERALERAKELTTEDWGRAYPGNNPESWESGLRQMQEAIAQNLEIAKKAAAE